MQIFLLYDEVETEVDEVCDDDEDDDELSIEFVEL